MKRPRLLLLLLIVAALSAALLLDLDRYLSFELLKAQQAALATQVEQNPLGYALGYILLYVVVTALSFPGAGIMSLAAGALFGMLVGVGVVLIGATLGATVAMWSARFLFRGPLRRRFPQQVAKIDAGIHKEGALYLFSLRLLAIFPYFLVNLLMGLTPIRTWKYMWVTFIGMIPATSVLVYAGTQLAQLDSPAGLFTPELLAAFIAMALLPWLSKALVSTLEQRHLLKPYPRPRHFDYNLVVIGAGAAGLVAAYVAATLRAKVALIERDRMGGDCLNHGCVPSKALIHSARLAHQLRQRGDQIDFGALMERVQRTIERIAPHDSSERYRALGVDCIQGEARLRSPYQIQVGERTLTSRALVIATGSRPRLPAISGLESIPYRTSDTLWSLRERPERLLVVGGGPVGCELAQAFARLGSRVCLVQRAAQLLPKEDRALTDLLLSQLRGEGIEVWLDSEIRALQADPGGHRAQLASARSTAVGEEAEEMEEIRFDLLLLASGREPVTEGLGLEALGIECDQRGFMTVDETLRSEFHNIYGCGDVVGPELFTHAAGHQGWHAAVNALLGGLKRFRADREPIPRITYTDPMVAAIDLNEQMAQRDGIDYELTRYELNELDRALIEEAESGFIQVLTVPGSGRLLGVSIIASQADQLLAEWALALRHRIGLDKLLTGMRPYPSWSDANKQLAGQWRRAHAPESLLEWAERLNRWRRGG